MYMYTNISIYRYVQRKKESRVYILKNIIYIKMDVRCRTEVRAVTNPGRVGARNNDQSNEAIFDGVFSDTDFHAISHTQNEGWESDKEASSICLAGTFRSRLLCNLRAPSKSLVSRD